MLVFVVLLHDWCAHEGGGDSPEYYRMPLPLSLNPQNYSRGKDKASIRKLRCSFCTSLVHPAYGGGRGGPQPGLDFVPGCVWLVHWS
jgi:hypothetical protein